MKRLGHFISRVGAIITIVKLITRVQYISFLKDQNPFIIIFCALHAVTLVRLKVVECNVRSLSLRVLRYATRLL